ncbi:MAG: MFS transporter [Planctomycetes bacterium]|nr:MFS transporter [Planctomycetota bacterium]
MASPDDRAPTDQSDPSPDGALSPHPPGFRLRRGQNWFFLGLTYATYYLCRYNLGIVAVPFKEALGFSNLQYGAIQSARNGAYGIGQFVNGLFTDRLGGKQAMTIGAIGTIILNLLFGLTAWSDIGWLFFTLLIIRLADGYVQAFGAPGMVKINTAWFLRRERGTFAGIFGIMINLGQMGVGKLGGLLATGFSVPLIFYTITVPTLDWRYMFIIPPAVVVIVIILMNLMAKNHPEEAGYRIVHDDEDPDDDPYAVIPIGFVFRKITSNPIVWIVAGAYFCTGFVRAALYDWFTTYMDDTWSLGLKSALVIGTVAIWFPIMASAGSLASGLISDKLFNGRRAPVAAVLYLIQTLFMVAAIMMSEGLIQSSATLAVLVILGIHTGCNATHSILGTAAAMDLGGRKMAGFAAGVIDSFQYFGAMLSGFGLGWFLDKFAIPVSQSATSVTTTAAATQPATVINPTIWFASMLPWGVLGTILMTYLWIRHRGTDERGT